MARRRRRIGWTRRRWLGVFVVLGLGMLTWWWGARFFAQGNFVARVLFSETASCTPQERALVAGVMKNRIGHAAFGRLPTLRAVAEQPGAFSCVGDSGNTNWAKTRYPARMKANEQAIWEACVTLAEGGGVNITPAVGPSGRPLVFYHDKSITTPVSWSKGAWRVVQEVTTAHFVFYSVVAAPR